VSAQIGRAPAHDVVVVGARIAGAATAMLLARRGLRVLLLDRGRPDADTISTLALMRCGVLQLGRWGLLDAVVAAGTPAIRRTLFHYGEETIAIGIAPAFGVDALFAPRRTVLDPILVDAARAAGVEVRFGVAVESVERDASGRVVGVSGHDAERRPFSAGARIVVGADGVASTIARAVAAPTTHAASAAGGTIYSFFRGIGGDAYEWAFAPPVAGGVIPTNDGAACVFVAATNERFVADRRGTVEETFDQILVELGGTLAGRVAAVERVERFHGIAGLTGYLRRPWGPGWALVGDAGYFKDPITAHGISDALRDAELAARAIARALAEPAAEEEALSGYEAERDRLSIELFAITERIARYDWTRAGIQELHRELSHAMHAEVELLAGLDPPPAV